MGKCNHMFYSFIKTKLILVAPPKKRGKITSTIFMENRFMYEHDLKLLRVLFPAATVYCSRRSCVRTAAVTCSPCEVCWPRRKELSQQASAQAAEGARSEPPCTPPDAALVEPSRRRAVTLSAHLFTKHFLTDFHLLLTPGRIHCLLLWNKCDVLKIYMCVIYSCFK